MNRCVIDVERSDRFKQEFREFQQKYPHTIDDVLQLFSRIADNPRGAAKGQRYPVGTDHEIYKYDCKSTDLKRGSNKAYRIIGLYEPALNVVTPLAIYLKPNDITVKEVLVAIAALRAPSAGPTSLVPPSAPQPPAAPPSTS